MKGPKDLVVGTLGTRAVSGTIRTVLGGRLRILAYHGVPDSSAFGRQLDEVLAGYAPVTGFDVVRSLGSGPPLPPRAVWITFDDGYSSVVENGLPLLQQRGLPATMFVCPGLVDSGSSPWWETVDAAVASGWVANGLVEGRYAREMKDLPDRERRQLVDLAVSYLSQADKLDSIPDSVATRSQLERWTASGLELGNHTWDHPCLDQCDPEEQRYQITKADEWLDQFGAFNECRLFAYPNGDRTAQSQALLSELGYDIGLLFDHRLSQTTDQSPLGMSRLRLDSAAAVGRARAIVSGGHSLIYRSTVTAPVRESAGMIKVLAVMDGTGTGGAETSMAAMAPLMAQNGIELEVAHFHDRSGAKERFLEAGIPLIHVPHDRSRLVTIWRLRKVIRQRQPDLVHTMVFEADIIGRTAAFLALTPVMSSIINEMYGPEQLHAARNPWKIRLGQLADIATARFVRQFHAITHSVADLMAPRLRINRSKIQVVYRGRDPGQLGVRTPERRTRVRDLLAIPEDTPIILAIGRQEPQKGLDVAIEALSEVIAHRADAVLLIAGRDGSSTPLLHSSVAELGLANSVRFLGHRADVADLLAAADVMVFPSRWEGLGGAVVEAMALGCPIVCSDLPVLREVLDVGGNLNQSILAPLDDPQALSRAVVEIIDRTTSPSCPTVPTSPNKVLDPFHIGEIARGYGDLVKQTVLEM